MPVGDEEPAAATAAVANGGGMRFELRLDAGLAKSAPDTNNLSSETYHTFRRRLDIFDWLCKRRGDEVVSEGALQVMQTLTGEAWDAWC